MTVGQGSEETAGAFFRFARRRCRAVLSLGVGAVVLAGVAWPAVGGQAPVLLAAVVLLGLAAVASSVVLARDLREARRLVPGPAQAMEVSTWPYRSMHAGGVNRVLVTLDRVGSTERTPLAEFRASWSTPGAAEAAPRAAMVYGSLSRGSSVLAVAEDGSCFTGRVTRTRA